jgi:hypothetical protein
MDTVIIRRMTGGIQMKAYSRISKTSASCRLCRLHTAHELALSPNLPSSCPPVLPSPLARPRSAVCLSLVVPCACPPRSRRSSAGRGLGLDWRAGLPAAGWLTWRRRRGHSAAASLQLCARAVPCPSASACLVRRLALPCVSSSFRPVLSCPVEILTVALLYCRTTTAAVHFHHHPPPPPPPQTRPPVCLPFVSQCPRDIPPEPLARSFARCRTIPAAADSTVASRPALVQRPAPSSASLDPLSSRPHARPRRCHLRYHQSSRGPGITPHSTQP